MYVIRLLLSNECTCYLFLCLNQPSTHQLQSGDIPQKRSAEPFKMSGEHSWVIISPRVCDIHPLPMITDVCMRVHLAKLILLAPLRILGSEGDKL